MRVAVIGGGAAGFYSAISVKEHHPSAEVIIYEKTSKVLSKVKVSGGGRCNVTNGSNSIKDLSSSYPRGGKLMKKLLGQFSTSHIRKWFESRGVALKTEADNRVFPVSDKSETIINCLLEECSQKSISIITRCHLIKIMPKRGNLELSFANGILEHYDKVIIATGGTPKKSGLLWLQNLGHEISDPIPSLFTFNMPGEKITSLMGVTVDNVVIRIQGSKLISSGPLLITHWGMSGPAVLKLSAYGARELNKTNYDFKVQINWVNILNNEILTEKIKTIIEISPMKKLSSVKPFSLPDRLWNHLIQRSALSPDKKWSELGKKGINKLIAILSNDIYEVKGKTTFKEEFVTCGGISLNSIEHKTMESKVIPNVFFAGEILDIDGITGGYNFQSAWTTGFIAGKLGNNCK